MLKIKRTLTAFLASAVCSAFLCSAVYADGFSYKTNICSDTSETDICSSAPETDIESDGYEDEVKEGITGSDAGADKAEEKEDSEFIGTEEQAEPQEEQTDQNEAEDRSVQGNIDWYSRPIEEIEDNLGITAVKNPISPMSVSTIEGSIYTDYGCASSRIRIGGQVGYCVLPWSKVPNGVSADFADIAIKGDGNENSYYQMLSKLIYYGFGGGGDLGYGETITHFALSRIWYEMGNTYGAGLSWTYTGGSHLNGSGQAKVNEFINKVKSLTNVKGTLHIAQLYAEKNIYQDIIYGNFELVRAEITGKPQKDPLISIYKKDDNGKPVKGAEFTVYGYDNAAGGYTKPVASKSTDSSGEIVFSLDAGSTGNGLFLIKETRIPEGYKASADYLNAEDKADFEAYGGRLYYISASGGACPAYRDTEALSILYEGTDPSNCSKCRLVFDHSGYLIFDVWNTKASQKTETCWWNSKAAVKWYENTELSPGFYRSVVLSDAFMDFSSDGKYSASDICAHTYTNNRSYFITGVSGPACGGTCLGAGGSPNWSYNIPDADVEFQIFRYRADEKSYKFRVYNRSSSERKIQIPTWTLDGDQSDIEWFGGTIPANGYVDYDADASKFDNLARLTSHVYINDRYITEFFSQTQEYMASIWVNEENRSVTLKKILDGNAADLGSKWDFTITITGEAGECFEIHKGDSVQTISVPSGNTSVSTVISLGNGESAVIKGLGTANRYSITENKANSDGYTTAVSGAPSGTAADNSVVFTNTKQLIVPAGLDLNKDPIFILVCAGISAAAFLTVLRLTKRYIS
jgi:hypothetical protein